MLATASAMAWDPRLSAGGAFAGARRPDDSQVARLVPRELPSTRIIVARDDEVVGQGAPAEYCYIVLSGCIRTVLLLEDGRRQVGEFLLPGDFFGWEALGEYDVSAEAVSPATLLRYSRRRLEELAGRDPALAVRLRALAAGQLRASRERIVLLGRRTAAERIAAFLVEMARRLRVGPGQSIDLPMSRADIADYLGLTIETVCRGISQFRRRALIAVERSRIAIRDYGALEAARNQSVH